MWSLRSCRRGRMRGRPSDSTHRKPANSYDKSGSLQRLQSDLGSAASGSRWTGSAASAYDTTNTEHRRVIGELAGLDQRLKAEVDQSARVVSAGRGNLETVRKWVLDAAATVPQNAAGERMLLPIVKKGLADVVDISGRMHVINGRRGGPASRRGDKLAPDEMGDGLLHRRFGKAGSGRDRLKARADRGRPSPRLVRHSQR